MSLALAVLAALWSPLTLDYSSGISAAQSWAKSQDPGRQPMKNYKLLNEMAANASNVQAYARIGDFASAIQLIQEGSQQWPNSNQYRRCAEYQFEIQDYEGAVETLRFEVSYFSNRSHLSRPSLVSHDYFDHLLERQSANQAFRWEIIPATSTHKQISDELWKMAAGAIAAYRFRTAAIYIEEYRRYGGDSEGIAVLAIHLARQEGIRREARKAAGLPKKIESAADGAQSPLK